MTSKQLKINKKGYQPPIDIKDHAVKSPFIGDETLEEKIASIEIFIVYGSIGYAYGIHSFDNLIMQQIKIAKRLDKPVYLMIDSEIPLRAKRIIESEFSDMNIIAHVEYDFKNKSAKIQAENDLNLFLYMYDDDDHPWSQRLC
jgi:hypothetical protein